MKDVEIHGLKETQEKVQKVADDLAGHPMVRAMRKATLVVQGSARRFAPVDTGRLRASITPAVWTEGNTVTGVVGSNVTYAPYMELGTGIPAGGTNRHWPPAGALEVWAQRHGFDSGFQVARIIGMRGGLEPRRYLEKAMKQNKNRVITLLQRAAENIISD